MSLLINNYKKGYEKGFVDLAEILKEITNTNMITFFTI